MNVENAVKLTIINTCFRQFVQYVIFDISNNEIITPRNNRINR